MLLCPPINFNVNIEIEGKTGHRDDIAHDGFDVGREERGVFPDAWGSRDGIVG